LYKKISSCRICGNKVLTNFLNLGNQMLTGVFPKEKDKESVSSGPLELVKCNGENSCGLVQMQYSYSLSEMYGDNYGYRSGLNKSMVDHLHSKVSKIANSVKLNDDDLIIDIGSNDATTLKAYPQKKLDLVGIDPTGTKFNSYYPDNIKLIPDFFSSSLVKAKFGNKKAKVVTSFSMFYDLEEPLTFMKEVYEILDSKGIWIFEQSYMPKMLEMNSFDTICHEHLEFYSLHQIKYMTDIVGFHIVEVDFNDINGGSFSITVRKKIGDEQDEEKIKKILHQEIESGLSSMKPYEEFANRIDIATKKLIHFVKTQRAKGKMIAALGASTKGNVLLQYCNFTEDDISFIGEVNEEKLGCFTPGTFIPIISEKELLSKNPDYLIVLPWHFKDFFINNKKFSKTKLVFPLPEIEIYG
jgi:NDP-4-keto-2,6-dideoxyhexose 3-C-methyltransferase